MANSGHLVQVFFCAQYVQSVSRLNWAKCALNMFHSQWKNGWLNIYHFCHSLPIEMHIRLSRVQHSTDKMNCCNWMDSFRFLPKILHFILSDALNKWAIEIISITWNMYESTHTHTPYAYHDYKNEHQMNSANEISMQNTKKIYKLKTQSPSSSSSHFISWKTYAYYLESKKNELTHTHRVTQIEIIIFTCLLHVLDQSVVFSLKSRRHDRNITTTNNSKTKEKEIIWVIYKRKIKISFDSHSIFIVHFIESERIVRKERETCKETGVRRDREKILLLLYHQDAL